MKPSDQDQNELNAADDAAFNEYLHRESAVSQHYRELDAADVPTALDQAVLSQAKAAVADKKVTRLKGPGRGIVRWSAPLALAASVVLVVSVVMQPTMQKEISSSAYPVSAPGVRVPLPEVRNESTRADQQESPVFVAPVTQQPSPALAVEPEVLQEKKSESDKRVRLAPESSLSNAQREISAQAIAAPPPPLDVSPSTAIKPSPQTVFSTPAAPVPAQPSARAAAKEEAFKVGQRAEDLSQVVVTGSSVRRQRADNGAGPRGTVSAAADAAPEPEPESEALPRLNRNDPEAWLVYIRAVRGKGDSTRADTEWRRFLRTYPAFVVEENDAARPPRR